jgi:EAL domain-containing protein (putative c-di-GMP-specific phosphodiesterase class I)
VDVLKIDQAFVSEIEEGPEGGAIIKAVVDLAHVLGLTVIAEGVETRSQRDRVSRLGCDASQGFYYAKPMPASVLGAELIANTMVLPHVPTQHRRSTVDAVADATSSDASSSTAPE